MFVIGLILTILGLIGIYFSYTKWNQYDRVNTEIEERNKEIENQNKFLIQINKDLLKEQEKHTSQLNQLKELTTNLDEAAKKSFEHYCETLDIEYKNKEQEYEKLIQRLEDIYNEVQDESKKDLDKVKETLELLKKTRAAAMEAQLKEEEIKKKKEFYSLNIPETDLKDAKILREIEYKLNNPRVLRMLIWSSFYQKPMTQLCNNVVGIESKTGVYKITNQLTDLCYIGQAVDISDRWKKHAKCGLGIDTPVNNKLYQNMQEYGLENFTFEIIEECKSTELNTKEKYYIELYQADKFGLNSKRR